MSITTTTAIQFRETVKPSDIEAVRSIVASTGFFYEPEIAIAVELVEDRLRRSESSDYFFVFAEQDVHVVGYTCYGPIACTVGSIDLYWIAVHDKVRGQGIGRALMKQTEQRIAAMNGRRIYIETSSREQYAPTRAFYERCGYIAEAILKDYYAPGDSLVIFSRDVNRSIK